MYTPILPTIAGWFRRLVFPVFPPARKTTGALAIALWILCTPGFGAAQQAAVLDAVVVRAAPG